MMMFPEDVMILLRQCSSNVGSRTDETSSESLPMPSTMMMSGIVVDNAKSHRNSVTEMTHITASNPPPLRPYLKTIGAAKRKRIVQQKMMDRWNASTTTNTPSTVTNTTDGLLPHHYHHQQPPMHVKAQNNRRTPRNSICLSPTQLPNCSESKDSHTTYHFSQKTLSSPTATTTNHAMLLCNMLYSGSACNNNISHIGNEKDTTHPKPNLMTDSPPSDSSPRIVRRLPSDDGGMDDIHRMMMLPPEKQNETNTKSTKLFLKRYAALPRRPERQSSQRDTSSMDHPESSDDAGTSHPTRTGNNDDVDDDVPTMTVTVPKKKLSGGVDMSPRKPARRFVSNAILTPLSPLSPSSRPIIHDDVDEEEELSPTHHASSPSQYHHHPNHSNHPYHRHIRTPTTNRNTVHSNRHHHNKNNHRTVKYLVEALTIVNLCDIENDTSSFHTASRHIHNMRSDAMEHLESRPRLPTTASIMSSSDESTVESIPSINSTGNHNPLHENNNEAVVHTTTKTTAPPSRTLSGSTSRTTTRFPQAA
jgi:hypothetical protein